MALNPLLGFMALGTLHGKSLEEEDLQERSTKVKDIHEKSFIMENMILV